MIVRHLTIGDSDLSTNGRSIAPRPLALGRAGLVDVVLRGAFELRVVGATKANILSAGAQQQAKRRDVGAAEANIFSDGAIGQDRA